MTFIYYKPFLRSGVVGRYFDVSAVRIAGDYGNVKEGSGKEREEENDGGKIGKSGRGKGRAK